MVSVPDLAQPARGWCARGAPAATTPVVQDAQDCLAGSACKALCEMSCQNAHARARPGHGYAKALALPNKQPSKGGRSACHKGLCQLGRPMLTLLPQVTMLEMQHLKDSVLDIRQAGQQGTSGQPVFGANMSGGELPALCPSFITSHFYVL